MKPSRASHLGLYPEFRMIYILNRLKHKLNRLEVVLILLGQYERDRLYLENTFLFPTENLCCEY